MSVARPQFPATTTATRGLALARPTAAPHLRGRHALRPVSLAVCLLGASPLGFALPEGATPTHGQVTVQTTTPGQMLIQQSTARAGLDWTSFSIAAGERVQVVQPDRSSVLLNRVLGDNPSLIYGALQSNGSVWLINPRGIVFGASSRVDVGGLVASTLTLSDEALLSGRLQLGVGAGGAGELRSEGQITAIDGTVALVAPQLFHSGQIEARRVALAAASEVLVDVEGDGLVLFNVKNQALETRLQMLGSVRADGGSAEFRAAARAGFADTVLNLDGVVQARSLGQLMGRVVVDGGAAGITQVGGSIDATSAQGRGGDVLVQGDKILLTDSARLDVSGAAGGGRLRVGGGFQGRDDTVRNASMVNVARGARLAANALQQGDGGELIVWSDRATRFWGAADARGGLTGGNGGLVEVSGKDYLDFRGTSDRSAPRGQSGLLLLDPTNLEIVASGPDIQGNGGTGDLEGDELLFGAQGVNSRITAGNVVLRLGEGSVRLQANELITVSAAISAPSATNSLTLQAGHGIVVDATINTAGSVTLSANTTGATAPLTSASVAVNRAITLTGAGVLTLTNNGGSGTHTLAADVTAAGLSLTGSTSLTAFANVSTLTVNSGTLTLAAVADRIADAAAVTVAGGATLSLGVAETVDTLSLTGTLGGAAALNATSATLSGGTLNSNLTASGDVTVTGPGTSTVLADVNANNILVNNGGILQVGNGGATGSLTATVSLGVGTGGVLAFNRSGTTDLGAVAGAGTVRVNGGTLRLTDTLPDITAVSVLSGGTLLLDNGSDNRINNAATLSVATGGTLTLGDNNETVGSLTLGGVLGAATGVLTAGSYTLNTNAQVLGGLGAGNLSVQGNATINSAVNANVSVAAGQTLQLGSNANLAANATVTVPATATLALGASSDTVQTLDLGGSLSGGPGFTLNATTHNLQGGAVVDVRLGGTTLNVAGPGTVTLQQALSDINLISDINVNSGTLDLTANGLLHSGAFLTVESGATLLMNGTATVDTLTLGGTVTGTNALSVTTFNTVGSSTPLIETTVNVSGNATVPSTVTLTLGGSGASAGALPVSGTLTLGGTLVINRDTAVLASTLLGTGSIGDAGTNPSRLRQAGTGTFTLDKNVTGLRIIESTGSGGLTLANGSDLSPQATVTVGNGSVFTMGSADDTVATLNLSGTLAGNGTLTATTANVPASATATLTGSLNAPVNIAAGGQLTLGAASSIADSRNVTVGSGATLVLGRSEAISELLLSGGTLQGAFTLTASAGTTMSGGTIALGTTLAGGQLLVTGNATLAGRAETSSVRINSPATLTLGNTADRLIDTMSVNIRNGGTLSLAQNETVASKTGSGTVTGAGVLSMNLLTLEDGEVFGASNEAPGQLITSGAVRITGDLVVTSTVEVQSGVLTVGSVDGDNGSLSAGGTTTVQGGAVLAYNRDNAASVTLSGTYAGAGTLRNTNSAALLITGSMGLDNLDVAGGNVTVGAAAAGGLGTNTAVTVAASRTLSIDNTDSIASLTLNGTLSGGGALTASSYTLNGGALVQATLGAGPLSVNGAATLAAAKGAGTLTVASNGSLSITGGPRLANTADLVIVTGGTLTLGADESVNSLNAGGTLAGNGRTLTTATPITLSSGGQLDANVSASALNVTGSSTLNGRANVVTLAVNDGTLSVAATADRIADGANVSVAGAAVLAPAGNETVATLALTGRLAGSATLTANTTLESGAEVLANLGGSSLSVNGNATLTGTAAATTVALNGGTLVLSSASRLASTANVTVDGPATLQLGGNQTVNTLNLAGTLAGTGTLTADTTLAAGASVLANLGGSNLSVSGNATLGGTAAATTVQIDNGTLTLGSAGRLASAANVTVAAPATLALGGNQTLAAVLGSGSVNLGSHTLTLASNADRVYAGTLTGTGGLTKQGTGSLTLGGNYGYSGTTRVEAGTLALTGTLASATVEVAGGTLTLGSANRLDDNAVLLVSAGATLTGAGNDTVAALITGGTLNGSGTLTAGSYTLNNNADVSLALGAGNLNVAGSATLRAAKGNGTVNVQSGGSLTLATGSDLASGADLVIATGGTLTLGADESVNSLNAGGTLAGNGRTLTTATPITLSSGGQLDANVSASALNVTGSSTLNGRANVVTLAVNDGTLSVAATADRIADGANVSVAGAAVLAPAGNETVATLALTGRLAGSATLTANTTLESGAEVLANLGGSSLSLSVNGNATLTGTAAATTVALNGGTLVLSSASRLASTANVTVDGPATLQLGGNQTVNTLNLAGTLAGTGTLTASAATGYVLNGGIVHTPLGSGGLSASGNSTLAATAAVGSATVAAGGTLTLGTSGGFSNTPVVTIDGTGTLNLGSSQTFGSLAGSGNLGLGSFTLTTGGVGNSSFGGQISGSGALVKTGLSAFTLTAAQNYSGSTLVAQGNLVLQGDNRLPDGSAVTVAAGATLTLGGADTVGSLTLVGTLSGTGTLTATSYTLAAGSATLAGADLGTGALSVTGNSSLGGTAGAGTVSINGGTLSLGSANRLADTAAVTVDTGAALALAGDDTVATLALAGNLAGSGHTLNATTTTLQDGASVGANLAGSTLRVTGDATLSGSAANTAVNVEGGIFTLASAERLSNTAALTVGGGATLLLGGAEIVGSLTLAGTLGSAGRTLDAATYTLQAGATAVANLGPGELTSTGNATLAGSSAAETVNVNLGTLTLASANRLADTAAVTVATDATLRLNGDDTVRTLALSGRLDGSGTLSAGTYTLTGGTYDTPLGAGDLTVSGNSTLNATSAAATVTISAGTLTLGAANRFTASPALTLSTGAGLALAGAETFGSVAGSGNVALGGGTLTHAGLADSVFSGSFNGSGGLVKAGASSFTLAGNNSYTGSTRVDAGTLRVAGTLASGTVQVAGGRLVLESANRLADATALSVGSDARLTLTGNDTVASLNLAGTLDGSGTLTAGTVDLDSGRVDANISAGALRSSGDSLLNGSAAAASLAVNDGTLTLGAADRLTAAPVTTVASGATLALQGDQTLGSLAGSGNVALGSFVLGTGAAGDSSFSGTLSGSGSLHKLGSSSFTLGGSQLYTGATRVLAGRLLTAAADVLPNGSVVEVANGATLTLGGSDTVASLTLAGTLAGSGTLTASSYALAGGTVDTALGAGSLSSSGNTRLNATSAATTVQVNTGTLTLGAANRLADGAALTVARDATLSLGGDDTVASLALAGTLAGSGTLSAATYTLDGANVSAHLGAGTLSSSGSSTLTGSVGALQVQVAGGTLTLAAADRLADTAALTVANGATLHLNANDTVGTLTLAGTLDGTGTLSAASYTLNGGTATANLGAGTLSSTGNSSLGGNSAAGTVLVNGGTLTLAGAGRLSAAPTTTVAAGAMLRLGGDATLGALAGAGALDLAAFTLTTGSGGNSRYDGVLGGTGNLVKAGSSNFTLGGANAHSGATQVQAGTLSTAAADVLPDATALSVAPGATLALGGNDRVASLVLGGTLQGSATLSAATYTLNSGTVVADLGSGRLVSTGNSRLDGSAAATEVAVDSGTLTLGAAERLANSAAVTVASGATLLLGGDDNIGQLTLAGTLGGSGSLGAASVAFNGGRADVAIAASAFTSSGNSTLNGTLQANSIGIDSGTLTLGAAQRLVAPAALTLNTGGTLVLAGNETLGTLAGSGHVALGSATLRTGLGGNSSYGGTLSGSGALVKQGSSNFTLAGTHSYSGSTTVEGGTLTVAGTLASAALQVQAGTLALAAADRLADTATVAVASGAALTLAGDDAVASLTLAGTLSGTGTLSAANVALEGGTASAALGAGTLRTSGNSRLEATSAATSVQVDSGTLTLAAADRLSDTATVAVARGATLTLAGNNSAASLTLAGTLNGSGTLTAASYGLDGATVLADLGTGTLRSTGNSRLEGRSSAGSVLVESGSFTLGSADRLIDSAALSVASGATLVLAATDTVASFTLAGSYTGGGTLTAASYLLDGGRADANLGAGSLSSRGNSTLAGTAAASAVAVESGTLTLASAQRLPALPALQVASGATLVFTGDQNLGSLAGAGNLNLGSFTLSTGSGGDSTFAGVISGSGGLIKQGSSSVFTLTGANSYTGLTRVAAGTLRVGDGGNTGSLATSAFELTGQLSLARSDTHTLAQPVSGSGGVEQAGSGRLVFSGNNKSYTGATTVTRGELATAGADELPDGSDLRVLAAGRVALGGRESVRNVDADGSVAIAGELVTSGDMLMRGAVSAPAALRLSGQRIDAPNAGNRFGGTVSIDARGAVTLASGTENNVPRSLVLGTVNVADGGRIDSGALSLTGVTTVTGGTLSLVAAAPLAVLAPDEELAQRQATSLPIAFAADAVSADANSRISVAAGAGLRVLAPNGGSVQLLQTANSFLGELSVLSGTPNSPWSANSTALSFNGVTTTYAVQSRVRLEGGTVNIGGDGVLADVVYLRADRVATVGNTAAIVARLPFDSTAGTATSLPALTLELTPASFELSFPFGALGPEGGLRVDVGSRAYGNRTVPLDAGYVTVLPRNGARGSTAVLLLGPVVNASGGYRFFVDGARSQTQIPVSYNGVLPTTPQVENSISATVAVSEGARKAGFDDAVRTENVAVRLRAGVIAEVGPAPAATQGTEGLRVPSSCSPAAGALLCGPGN